MLIDSVKVRTIQPSAQTSVLQVYFTFLWQFTKVLSTKINPELVLDTMTCWDIPRGKIYNRLCAYLPSTVLMAASFQCTDSKAVDPLLTAIPVSTITAANKEMKMVHQGKEPC